MLNKQRIKYFSIALVILSVIVFPVIHYSYKLHNKMLFDKLKNEDKATLNRIKMVFETKVYCQIMSSIKMAEFSKNIIHTKKPNQINKELEQLLSIQFDELNSYCWVRYFDHSGKEIFGIPKYKAANYPLVSFTEHMIDDDLIILDISKNKQTNDAEKSNQLELSVAIALKNNRKEAYSYLVFGYCNDEFTKSLINAMADNSQLALVKKTEDSAITDSMQDSIVILVDNFLENELILAGDEDVRKEVFKNRKGQFTNNQARFTFSNIPDFNNQLYDNIRNRIRINSPLMLILYKDTEGITIKHFKVYIIINCCLLLMFLITAWVWSGLKVKQLKKEREIVELNRNLEQKVKLRTKALEDSKMKVLNNFQLISNLKKQADESNRVKSIFLTNMGHETRTPLNSIIGFAQLLEQKNEDKNLDEYIHSILESGNELLVLINEILDTAKIEAGEMKIKPANVNVGFVLNELKKLFENECKKKSLEFHIDLYSDFPHGVVIDKLRFKQIIYNLLNNAVKFTSKGFVSIKLTVSKYRNYKGDLVVQVCDSGIGMFMKDIKSTLELFKQSDDSITRKFGGVGLGLRTTSKLIELMGGSMEIASIKDNGTTITVKIPSVQFYNSEEHVRNQIDNKVNVSLNNSDIRLIDLDVEEIIELRKTILPIVKEIKEKRTSSRLKKLAEIIIKIGNQNASDKIKKYGYQLKEAQETFNVEKINVIIHELIN